MSATLFLLVPIGTLAAVWSLCFVGCLLQTHGEGEPSPYSVDILAETTLVAYWSLGDLPGSTTAVDLSGNNHNGTYTIPPAYPSVQFSKQFPNPAVNLRQPSIVPGDFGGAGSGNPNLAPASVDFEGGYVSIPWSTQNPPKLNDFTCEAWILPNWTGANLFWVVFSAYINNTGFRFFVNDKNHWELVFGTGPGNTPISIDTMVPVDLTMPTYVALTCDKNGNAKLWSSQQGLSDTPNPPPPQPAWTSGSTPTGYVAADPSALTAIFIGAGLNDQPLRTPTMNPDGAPLYPFQGRIQSVAVYQTVLSDADIQAHFSAGEPG